MPTIVARREGILDREVYDSPVSGGAWTSEDDEATDAPATHGEPAPAPA